MQLARSRRQPFFIRRTVRQRKTLWYEGPFLLSGAVRADGGPRTVTALPPAGWPAGSALAGVPG